MTSPKVLLVGPPGSGKSTVGPILAARLGVDFADSDLDVEAAAGKAIADIFTSDGEPAFRELEASTIAEKITEHTGVYSLGGGAVLAEQTRELLAEHAVVFLSVNMSTGVKRTGMSTARPVLAGVNPRSTYKTLLDARLPLYQAVATVEIETDTREPDEVADAAIAGLQDPALAEGTP